MKDNQKKRGLLIRNVYTYDFNKEEGEKNTIPSLTIPDQTLPLKVLVERFTRGQSVATLQPVFNTDTNILGMDAIERKELAKKIRKQIQELEFNQQKRKQEGEAKKSEANKEES